MCGVGCHPGMWLRTTALEGTPILYPFPLTQDSISYNPLPEHINNLCFDCGLSPSDGKVKHSEPVNVDSATVLRLLFHGQS